jgi:hypothetical protein
MPTVCQTIVDKLLDHIGAKVRYTAFVMVSEITGFAPPWEDALPEDKPSVRGVSLGMCQRIDIRLLHQISHDTMRQVTTSDLNPARVVTDAERLTEQSCDALAVRLWSPFMLDRSIAGPGGVSQPDDAAAQDHPACLCLRKQLWSGHAVDNPNTLGTTHRACWHGDLRLEGPYAGLSKQIPS